MKIDRRSLLFAIGAAACIIPMEAPAQDYPSRPITILLGFGPGGNTDTTARLYAEKMSELLGVPVLIENKPGGQQLNVIREILRAEPDGYTLYATTGSMLVQNPALRESLSYDVFKDFTLISRLADNPGVVFIDPDLPVNSLLELTEYAKANPDTFNYGTAGIGSAGHLYAEAIFDLTGAGATQITYTSDAEVIREVIAGNVQMGIMTTTNTVPQVQAGNIRALAVISDERLPYLPDVPALPELGIPGLEPLSPHTFIALVGPSGLPTDIADLLSETVMKIGEMPDIQERIRDTLYAEPSTSTPEEFQAFIEEQVELWKPLRSQVQLPGL